ncbi:M48 family metallopeptidase [Candidatus Riflebacteria bacterium]
MRKKYLYLALSSFFCLSTGLFAKNIFEKLLSTYQKYQQVNSILWLLGDTGAEKRFGQEVTAIIKLTNRVSRDQKLKSWAKGIFARLVAQAPNRGLPYRLTILEGNTNNAFAVPGGNIFIYTGMLKFLQSDDEVASVLGHEIAHVARRHALSSFRRNALFVTAIQKLSKKGSREQLLAYVATAFAQFKFSRTQELESDRLGFRWMKRSGYNPAANVYVWEKMKKKANRQQTTVERWMSTHPTHQKRIDQARGLLKEMGQPESFNFRYSYYKKDKQSSRAVFASFDGSFENDRNKDNLPDGVFFLTPGIVWDRTFARSGKSSIKMNPNRSLYDEKLSSDFIPIDGRLTYQISSYFKSERGKREVSFGVEVYDSKKYLLKSFFNVLSRKPVSTVWRKYSGMLNGRRNSERFPKESRYIRLIILGAGSSEERLWIDDLDVRKVNKNQDIPFDLNGDFDDPRITKITQLKGWKSSMNAAIDSRQFYKGRAALRLDSIAKGVPTYIESPRVPISLGESLRLKFVHRSTIDIKSRVKLIVLDEYGRRVLPRNGKETIFDIKSNLVWTEEDRSFNLTTLKYPQNHSLRVYLRFENGVLPGNHFWLDEFFLSKAFKDNNRSGIRQATKSRRR